MNLGKLALKSVYANASLTTRFAIHSLICVSIMTIALWFIVSNYLISQILDREWRTTAQIVRADVENFSWNMTSRPRTENRSALNSRRCSIICGLRRRLSDFASTIPRRSSFGRTINNSSVNILATIPNCRKRCAAT